MLMVWSAQMAVSWGCHRVEAPRGRGRPLIAALSPRLRCEAETTRPKPGLLAMSLCDAVTSLAFSSMKQAKARRTYIVMHSLNAARVMTRSLQSTSWTTRMISCWAPSAAVGIRSAGNEALAGPKALDSAMSGAILFPEVDEFVLLPVMSVSMSCGTMAIQTNTKL
eukprot:scaffold206885_cov42-Prasinocladus_malaysianus.AAC.3